MRFFYVPEVKRYVLIGAIIAFIAPIILRFFISSWNYQELLLHHTIRQKLGFPSMEYAGPASVMITMFFQIFYACAGGALGMLYFKIRYRHEGFTLLTTQALRTVTGVFICTFLYFFLYADMFNMIYPYIDNAAIRPIATLASFAFRTPRFNDDMFRLVPSTPPEYRQPNPYVPPPQTNPPSVGNPQPQPEPERMATPGEIVAAINNYRAKNGRPALGVDDFLMGYAQERSNYFTSIGKIDNHEQFFKDIHESRFSSYYSLGENSSYTGAMSAERLVEEVFKNSAGHDENQLSTQWTHVGVGVNGYYIDVVYGRK